jgi:hypothetical protein
MNGRGLNWFGLFPPLLLLFPPLFPPPLFPLWLSLPPPPNGGPNALTVTARAASREIFRTCILGGRTIS